MKGSHYTVLARNRPIRVAFLVDTGVFGAKPDELNALLDSIVDWNYSHWGGRTNPIIFFSGETLTQEDWRLLELADPDCIRAFAPLSPVLIESLDERVRPWSIEVSDKSSAEPSRMSIEMEGLAVPPTPINLARLRGPGIAILAGRQEKLLMFEFSDDCDPDIRRFIHRNFGTYYQWQEPKTNKVRRIAWLENLMPKIQTHSISISDRASLAAALVEISGRFRSGDIRPSLPFVAPYQLAALDVEPWPAYGFQQVYQLIIGDSLPDFSEFWNSALWKRNSSRTHEGQLWIPPALMQDAGFHEALLDWLRRYTGCDSNSRKAEPVSFSLPPDEVENIRKNLYTATPPIFTNSIAPEHARQRREKAEEDLAGPERFMPWDSRSEAVRLIGIGSDQRFTFPKPEVLLDEFNSDGSWMVDLQIEHLSESRRHQREQCWWLLPLRNSAALIHAMFRGPARLTRDRRLSVHVQSQNIPHMALVKPEVNLCLTSDSGVIHWLLRQPHSRAPFTSDVRYKLPPRAALITGSSVSEKGAFLSGLIGLFGDFWTAKSYCERKFWRHLFSTLAGHGRGDDETLRAKLQESLKEALPVCPESKENTAALVGKILHLVRGRLRGVPMTLNDCKQARARLEKDAPPSRLTYPQGNTLVQHHGLQALSAEDMFDGLNELLARGVLRVGINKTCPSCKVPTWYHADDLRQELACTGCGYTHSLSANEEWSYALNTLAQTSVSQGVLGVLHALATLASNAHTFFVYSPSLDLYRNNSNQAWHEVDILCVADGDFIIGEVKEGIVQESAFDDLAEVAEALRPQRAIMFLPLQKANEQSSELNTWLTKTQTRLAPLQISAEIFTLPEF